MNLDGSIDDAGGLAVGGATADGGAVDTTDTAHLPPYENVLWIMKV